MANPIAPALASGLIILVVMAAILDRADMNPLAFARLGTQFSQGNPAGTEGYDGQFVYYIAREISPHVVEPYLDVPPYRYQRILLPFLSRGIAFGNVDLLPWAIPLIALLSQVIGTWIVGRLLQLWAIPVWYALTYGLWVGFMLAIRLDLPEPLAYALVAGAVFASLKGRYAFSWLLYALALFAKEVAILFIVAQLLDLAIKRQWRLFGGLTVVSLAPYGLFQLWLWSVFGSPGIGSGGANATSFEWLPFAGLIKVGAVDLTVFFVFLLVFLPVVVLPSLWGIWEGVKRIRQQEADLISLSLLLNAIIIPFVPFSTFREPGGLLRFSCGITLAVILYAAQKGIRRLLNYSFFTIALNVFLIE